MERFQVGSTQHNEMLDITQKVAEIVRSSGVRDGLCTVYVPHATCAIMINENDDPHVCLDIMDSLAASIPKGKWRHDRVDGNAASHIKAGIIGPSQSIPVHAGKLLLGRWQSIMLAEFDGPRERDVLVQIMHG